MVLCNSFRDGSGQTRQERDKKEKMTNQRRLLSMLSCKSWAHSPHIPCMYLLVLLVTPSSCMRPAPRRCVSSSRRGLLASRRRVRLVCGWGRPVPESVSVSFLTPAIKRTFVLDQPKRKASSFANSSPKPSIRPLTKGKSRLMAAPRTKPQKVGGE